MSWRTLTVMLGLLWVSHAAAQPVQTASKHWLAAWCCGQVCPSVGCCPDDYCRKPQPCLVDIPRCGGCDDYCRKPLPCLVDIPRCGGCDDYCRKPLPTLLCPPWSPFLRCAPPACTPAWGR